MHIKKSLKTAPFLVSMLILAACGGGGGGDDEADTTMALSSNNAHTVSAGESMSSAYSQNSKPASANDGFAAKLPGGSGSTPGDKLDPNNPTPDDVQPGKLHATSSSSSSLRVSTPGNEAALDNGKQPASRNGESAYAAASSASSAIRNPGNPVSGNSQPGPSRGASFAASSANSSAASSQAAPSAAGNDAARNPDRQVAYGGEAEHAAASSSAPSHASGDTEVEHPHSASSSASSQAKPLVKPSSVDSPEALEYALQTGDASVVSAKQVTQATLAYLSSPAAPAMKWLDSEQSDAITKRLDAIGKMLERLDKGSFTTTWSSCFISEMRATCSGDGAYNMEFATPAKGIQSRLSALDKSGTRIFGKPDYRLEQLLVLLGDAYRKDVSYGPAFTKESDKTAFLRALFSDFASYMSRDYNMVAKNLGNFSGTFPADTKTIEREVSVPMPTTGTTDYASGLYVLPGRSVTLTRTDTGSGEVRFGINMLRDTTHAFDQLDRPTLLASPRPALKPNIPITINNPYGGPLYLFVSAAKNQPDVRVLVSGVITHPMLRDVENPAAIEAFKRELDTTPTNWVVVATDMVNLHTTMPKFREALSTDGTQGWSEGVNYHGDIQQFVSDTWTYFTKIPYELAGFTSDSGKLSLAPSVKRFCDEKGWDCTGPQHHIGRVQHVIADIPESFAAVAGNPYDQMWAFLPLGYVESHEVGHNLQRDRLKIYASISKETSNNIFPTYKHIRYNRSPGAKRIFEDTTNGAPGDVRHCPYDPAQTIAECVFNVLKQTKASERTIPSMSKTSMGAFKALWTDPTNYANYTERVMFYRQLVEFARYYNPEKFTDGWELYTLLYLLDRDIDTYHQIRCDEKEVIDPNCRDNYGDDPKWIPVRDKFGFSQYSSSDSIEGNDFMVVASSIIIGRDMRPVFDMWGISYSMLAMHQLDDFQPKLPKAEEFFFPMNALTSDGDQVKPPILVAPDTVYPTN